MHLIAPKREISPEGFSAVTRLLSGEQPLHTRLRESLALLSHLLSLSAARVMWWSGALWEQPAEQVSTGDSTEWSEHLTREVLRSGSALRLEITGANQDVQVFYGAPLAWNEQTFGAIELRGRSESLGTGEIQIVEMLRPIISAVIVTAGTGHETTSLVQHNDHSTLTPRQHTLIQQLEDDLDAPLALNSLVSLLLRWALDSTGAEAGAISLVDDERGELILQTYEGYPHEPFPRDRFGEPRRRIRWDSGLVGRAARTGRATLARDVSRDADFQPSAPQIRAELAVPILQSGRVLAVLTLDSPRSAAFGDAELAFALALCETAAAPLRRAIWYQQALESSSQLSQVFSSIPNGLALLDRQGKVLRTNPAWNHVWNITNPPEGDFHIPWDLVPLLLHRFEDPLALNEFCERGQENPSDMRITTVVLRDPYQELQLLVAPTYDSINQLVGFLWVVADVTREREADRLKSEFISIVSHELRTPLTSILGYTELLLTRTFAPAEQREFVKTVYDQANHLSQIVEDLLGVSRLEAGKVQLNQWVVSIRTIVNELTAQLNSYLSARHRMVIDMPQRLPPVYVDRDKVKQIFVNLLTNAVKYSPKGGEIVVKIEEPAALPEGHPEGSFLLISVRDQGLGIAPEDLPQIWERFYRVDNSNTRRIGGTGLGLSITKSLVEMHNGRVWVESVLNQGSTFFFTLPIAVDAITRR